MTYHGKIVAVTSRPVGAEVSASSAGATVHVRDASMFDVSGGVLAVEGVEVPYVAADPDGVDGDTVTLADPLAVGLGDRLEVRPFKSQTVALVRVWDDAEPVPVVLDMDGRFLPEGVRDDPEAAETVVLEHDGREFHLADVVGSLPDVPASYIDDAEELLLADQKRLGEKLAENDAAIESAQTDLDAAEARIDDAFDEIELKPDQDYVDAAKQQAIDAAAITAQEKADAARDAAITLARQGLSNQVANPGFENGTEGWSDLRSVTLDPGNPRSGSQSVRLGPGAVGLNSARIPVAKGQTWRWTVWYQTTPDFTGNLGMRPTRHGDPNTTGNVPGYVNFAVNEEWTKATFDWTVNDESNEVNMRLASSVNTGAIWVDDFALENVTDLIAIEQSAIAAADANLAAARLALESAIASGDAAAIADAEEKIATAKQEAIAAAEADATAKAAEAMQKANAALTAAQSAQATADNAIRTWYSEEPPWADNSSQPEDVLGDMWYQDSTGQAYRWNGTIWKVIQDASIGEALAAAADAQTTADGKITAFYQPNEPLEGDEGDIWFDTDNDSAIHRRTGGQWVALLDPKALADAAESNAKAHATTMTNGLAKGVESTALPGTTAMPKDSVWRVVDAQGNYSAVFVQQTAPEGNDWQARAITSEVIDNVDAGSLTVSGDTVLRDAVAETFAAKLANIIEANIGNLTVTGDTHLEDLVAQRIAGDTASFMSLTVDQILAGFLQAQWIITESGSIVAGDPTGARVEIRHDGVRVYVVGPNGDPYEAVSMVNGEISFGVIGQDGTRLGGIDSGGGLSATTAAIRQDPKIKGSPLLGRNVGGGDQQGWLDALPGGLVGSTASQTTTGHRPAGVEAVYLRYRKRLQPNRTYRIVGYLTGSLGSNNGVLRANVRYRTGGAAASVSSTELFAPGNSAPVYNSTVSLDARVEGFYWVEVPTMMEFVLTYRGLNGSTARAERGRMYIEDIGPRRLELGEGEDATPKVLYTSTWRATASRNYDKTGATIAGQDDQINQWYWVGAPTDFRPAAWLYGGGAVEADDPLEMGKTLSQALTGANVERVEVYVRNKIWYGGVEHGRIVVGTLSSSTLPSTALIEGQQRIDDLGSGESARFDVPTSWFTNGANRGITMGDKDGVTALGGQGTVGLHSGQFHGPDDDDPPMLIVTYSR